MPAGRPSDYSTEIADKICERLAEGDSLRTICDEEGMPSKATVFRWLAKHPEFETVYARAREVQAEVLADEITTIADDGRNDLMEILNKDGEPIGWRENGEVLRRSQLRVATRQWIAERMLPHKYGTKIKTELTGANGGPIETADVTDKDRAKALLTLLGKADKGQ